MTRSSHSGARSSAGEHYLDMVGVTGSIPVAPTSLRLLRKLRLASHLEHIEAKQAKAATPKPASQATAWQAKPSSIVAKQAKAASPKPVGEGGLASLPASYLQVRLSPASTTTPGNQIDELSGIFWRTVASPGHVLIRPRQHQRTIVDAGAFAGCDVQHLDRYPRANRFRHQVRNIYGGVEAQQRVIRTQRVIKRASIVQPDVRDATARHCGWREVRHAVGRRRCFVVRDDRRPVVIVPEIQPAAAVLLNVEIVRLFAQCNPGLLTGRVVGIDIIRALRFSVAKAKARDSWQTLIPAR